jgi:Fanconi anemia group I protein
MAKSQSVCVLEFLPKCFSRLAAVKDIAHPFPSKSEQETFTGEEFLAFIMNGIITSKWKSENVVQMATTLREIAMTEEQADMIIHKFLRSPFFAFLCSSLTTNFTLFFSSFLFFLFCVLSRRSFKTLELDQLPSLVYQLLLFGKKGHKKEIIKGIIDFFNVADARIREKEAEQDSEEIEENGTSPREMRQIEGSVILHFNFSIKHDHDLGTMLIKLFKSQGSLAFTPFSLSLMFSLSHIHRFAEKALDAMRAAIVLTLKDNEISEKAEWLASVVPAKTVNVEVAFLEVIANSMSGWEYVTQSLVHLGVILMDSAGRVAGTHGKKKKKKRKKKNEKNMMCLFDFDDSLLLLFLSDCCFCLVTLVDKATEKSALLGHKILLETFKAHENVRPAILEQIFNRVVTKSASAIAFIALLKDIVDECPHSVLKFLSKVKEVLDYLALLPLKIAEGLLDAVKSIIPLDQSFRDHLALVLRKAMFSKYNTFFFLLFVLFEQVITS